MLLGKSHGRGKLFVLTVLLSAVVLLFGVVAPAGAAEAAGTVAITMNGGEGLDFTFHATTTTKTWSLLNPKKITETSLPSNFTVSGGGGSVAAPAGSASASLSGLNASWATTTLQSIDVYVGGLYFETINVADIANRPGTGAHMAALGWSTLTDYTLIAGTSINFWYGLRAGNLEPSVSLSAQKVINSNDRKVSARSMRGKFDFAVSEKGVGVVATGTNGKGGRIDFSTISYGPGDFGKHYYKVTETGSSLSKKDRKGWDFDAAEYKIAVTVGFDVVDNEINLIATPSGADELVFTNTYVRPHQHHDKDKDKGENKDDGTTKEETTVVAPKPVLPKSTLPDTGDSASAQVALAAGLVVTGIAAASLSLKKRRA